MKKSTLFLTTMLFASAAFAHYSPYKHCHVDTSPYKKYTNMYGDPCHDHASGFWHCTNTQD